MIEIKNKRMILYPEDRLIGAKGDVMTAQKKFVLDAVQDGFDLSDFVAFIKIEPCGEEAYDQMLKKEKCDEKLVLTWSLSGANLKNAGELSAQVILASPDYFNPEDLNKLSENVLIVPTKIVGVSAPVWQSFKEIFVVDESIDSTLAYKEVTKNVLTAAIAKAAECVEQCESLYSGMSIIYGAACDNQEASEEIFGLTTLNAQESIAAKNEAIEAKNETDAIKNETKSLLEQTEQLTQRAEAAERNANQYQEIAYAYEQSALEHANNAAQAYEQVKSISEEMVRKNIYRPIFTKTLTEEDAGIVSFEITRDDSGAPFNLRAFAIYMYIPKMEGVQSSYIRLDIKSDNNDGYSRISQFVGLSKANDVYSKIEAECKGRWSAKISKSNAWFQNAESVNVTNSICANSRSTDGKSICAIRLLQASTVNVDFPVGTQIEVWGVDAPENEEG